MSAHRLALITTLFACASDPTSAPDAGTTPTRDASAADAATSRDAANDDAAAPDARVDSDAGLASPDASSVSAVLDDRCAYNERVGLLSVTDYGGGQRDLGMYLNDAPFPWFGPPTSSDAACVFHQSAPMMPCACGAGEICDYQNRCVREQRPLGAIEVILSGRSGTQTFVGDGVRVEGPVTLADSLVELRVQVGGLEITAPAMSIPEELTGTRGTLVGTENAPMSVDLSWDAPTVPAEVYTHININHHIRTPTFTECVVPGEQRMIHIDAPMLTPLAVGTGLEFQGLEHIRYARAQLPFGCFEIRFTRVQFVSLGN